MAPASAWLPELLALHDAMINSASDATDDGERADRFTRRSMCLHAGVLSDTTRRIQRNVPVEAFARRSNLYNRGDISIYVASRRGICDVLKTSPEGLADTTFLELDLPRGWPPPRGTYPIVSTIGTLEDGGATMGAFAKLIATVATRTYIGTDDDARAIDGGTVTIETGTDAIVTGRFDLQFQKGELRGTFSVGTTRSLRRARGSPGGRPRRRPCLGAPRSAIPRRQAREALRNHPLVAHDRLRPGSPWVWLGQLYVVLRLSAPRTPRVHSNVLVLPPPSLDDGSAQDPPRETSALAPQANVAPFKQVLELQGIERLAPLNVSAHEQSSPPLPSLAGGREERGGHKKSHM